MFSDKLQEDKFGIKIRVVRNGSPEDVAEVELKVDVTKNGRFTVEFLLMNEGQQTVTLARCILLKSYGFKLEAKSGTILEPGNNVVITRFS
jgi:hypothetical protein